MGHVTFSESLVRDKRTRDTLYETLGIFYIQTAVTQYFSRLDMLHVSNVSPVF